MKTDSIELEITPTEIQKVIDLLAETLQRITTATAGLPNENMHIRPEPDEWSVNEVVAHLRCCVDVWGKTIDAMLAQDNPTLRHISPRGWIKKTNYLDLSFQDSFQLFATQRTALLDTLKNLPFEKWSRTATIKRPYTVFSQLRRMALHESEHCNQIEAILKVVK
jgi:hypothetical protein